MYSPMIGRMRDVSHFPQLSIAAISEDQSPLSLISPRLIAALSESRGFVLFFLAYPDQNIHEARVTSSSLLQLLCSFLSVQCCSTVLFSPTSGKHIPQVPEPAEDSLPLFCIFFPLLGAYFFSSLPEFSYLCLLSAGALRTVKSHFPFSAEPIGRVLIFHIIINTRTTKIYV